MTVLEDSREQWSYSFKNSKRVALVAGDYSTVKLKDSFVIERKSLSDLYGTLTNGNQRFKAELFRAAWERITICVYVEGTKDDFINKRFPKGSERLFTSAGLEKLITTFERKYHLCFHWHTSRSACKKAVYNRLLLEERKLENR